MANFHLIRDLCEKNKITIRELALRIGKKENTIQAIVKNGSTNTTTIEEIAAVLNVPVGYFFDDMPISNQSIYKRKSGSYRTNAHAVCTKRAA